MAEKKQRDCKQSSRIDEKFELFEVKHDPRASIAKLVMYAGTGSLFVAALVSLYAASYVPLMTTATPVVPSMMLVIRYYFQHRHEREEAMSKAPTRRVQFEMPERSFERLQQLQELTEATSYAEVVRNALRVYEALWHQTANRSTIIVRQPDGTELPLNLII